VQYDAFISYSHAADERLALALERALERIARPWLKRRGLSIFRDGGNLNLSPHLWGSLERALDESKFLLVLASPASAQSPWVAREIEHWRLRREVTQVILVVSGGSLTWDAGRGDFDQANSTAIPASLHGVFPGEPYYLDMRWVAPDTDLSLENPRFKAQIVQLAAALKGVAVEDIAGEEFEQHRRMIRIRNAAITCLAGLTLASVIFGVSAWMQRGAALAAGAQARQSADEARASARIAEQRRRDAQAARQQADASAAIATRNETIANRERERAEHEAQTARVALAEASTREAVRLIAEDNPTSALAHLARALRLSPGDLQAMSWISGLVPDARAWMALPHDAPVASATFSRDGQRVLTISSDSVLSEWDAATGRRLAAPLSYKRPIRSAVFSSDGNSLVVIGAGRSQPNWDGKLVTLSGEAGAEVWDPISGRAGAVLRHREEVFSAAFSPDGLLVLTASKDNSVQIWESSTGRPVGGPLIHPAAVRTAFFMPDGRRVATGAADGSVRVWDANGDVVGPFQGGTRVDLLRVSADGRRIVTVAYDTAQVWDALSGKPLGSQIRHEQEPITTAAFSPDGRLLAVGSIWDSSARLWDYAEGKPVGPLLSHNDALRTVAFSPDGKWLLTSSDDRTARLWDTATGRQVGMPFQHPERVNAASFSPDGRRIITACDDATARVWDVAAGATGAVPLTPDAVASAAFSADGRRLTTASIDGTVRVWESATRRSVAAPRRYAADVVGVAFSQDAREAVTVTSKGAVRIWNARTGQATSASLPHEARVSTVDVSSDRRRILTASADNTARVWDATTGRVIAKLQGHSAAVTSAAFSPDGRLVVTASDDSTARVWDAFTGRSVGAVLQHRQKLTAAAFSPDGRRILTASHDYTARLWDSTTGRPVVPPLQHKNFVFDASFSADGRRVVTASADDTARIWDSVTGMPIGSPMRHHMWVYVARFSPDGRRIVTGSMDATARVWDAVTGLPLGPPLRHGANEHVKYAAFSPDGRWIVTMTSGGILRLWPILLGRSVEGDVSLADLAEVLGGFRLTDLGAIAPLSESERQARVHRLLRRDGSGFVKRDELLQALMPETTR
jgi:WD40 repeat protein